MTSEVLGINSAFNSPKELRFADHLLENNILDDLEPLYENGDIIKKIFNTNNKFSKSLMRIHEETLNPVKEENIYENVGFIENTLNSINEKRQIKLNIKEDDMKIQKQEESIKNAINSSKNDENIIVKNLQNSSNRFTSTLSVTICKPLIVEVNKTIENNEISVENEKSLDEIETKSDDGSFKSSYAKSLLDSFRKNFSIQSSSVIENLSKPSSPIFSTPEDNKPSVTFMYPLEKEIILQNSPNVYTPKNNNCISNKALEQLEKRVSSLTDNILLKDKELEKLRQEIMFLKLECNRVKAENRSLKAGMTNGIIHRSSFSNGDSTPHSPVSSTSADSDTWTLQQQVLSLNAQLEKAEISRHAYEAATRQLVHFLQTINSTLTTVAGPDAKIESPFTAQNTSELLNNLEFSLLQTKPRPILPPKIKTNPYFDASRDGSFLTNKTDLLSPSGIEKKYKSNKEVRNLFPRERKPSSEANGGPESITSNSSQDSLQLNRPHDAKEDSEKNFNSKDFPPQIKVPVDSKEDRSTKRSSPQRRFSISHKIWNASKRTPLMRSGSVNNLPTEVPPVPRVSRAVSTHCVAIDKVKHIQSDSFDVSASPNSNKILSSKAKDFFSSLRNIFKAEERIPSVEASSSSSSSSSSSKKKMTLPSIHRSAKVKSDPPPLSLPSSAISSSSASQTNLKKRHSIKTLSMPRVLTSEEADRRNSVFYVPSVTRREDEVSPSPTGVKSPPSPHNRSRSSSASEITADSSGYALSSGPQELSLALSLESQDDESSSSSESSNEKDITSSAHVHRISVSSSSEEPVQSGKEDCLATQEHSRFISFMDPIMEKVYPERTNLEVSAPFNCLVTGDGNCTKSAHRGNDSSTQSVINGEGSLVKGTGRTHVEVRKSFWQIEENYRRANRRSVQKVESCRYSMADSEDVRRRRLNGGSNVVGVQRRRSDFDAVGLKVALWKLSRESFRAKECHVAFV